MLTNVFAVTAAMAATASAFDCSGHYFSFFNRAGPMSYQRVDPALFPGAASPHIHSFDGGNAVSASSTFDTQMGSTCTTARIKPDKSLYWRPTLFWNGNNTGFYRVPEKAAKVYYKSGDGSAWANVTEFPEDFNMIAGDPAKRADGDNPGGVRWACHQANGGDNSIFTNGFPSGFQSCEYGFASEVTFPSCWNGQKLDPSKPSAHMAYPSNAGVGIENCPTTHRAARFPTIFMEFWYDVSSFNGQYSSSSTPWVLSNGDPTGYSMHADFLNGWEKGVLAKATGETGGCNCGCACGNDEMKQCFGAENVNDDGDSSFAECSASKSDAIAKLDKLPGCNPIQSGPARATVVSGAGCDATQVASSVASATSAVISEVASAIPSAYSEAFSVTVPAGASVTASAKTSSSRTRRIRTSSAAISISLANKGNANDYAYPTAAADTSSAHYPYPSANSSSIAPTPTGRYSSSPVHASTKAHGHNHSRFHKTTAAEPSNTAYPLTPSNHSNNDTGGKAPCNASVTVTYTSTVYVTAAANKTAREGTTVTQTSTVTAPSTIKAAASGYGS
ncbi:uncharacterized protein EKO05_0006658 [Ascochyta rabiei]|uniref:Uncharacterized protein n=1 Tax=Didymella rabiei TaxID=5454 RepID=A0A162WCC3_DIDRA|nr:uncharacterized protein EKO05_0006658 [Ascochyta rabiei]KZM18944.1 hypothetical protein ST47_g9910 [Ascochyta rabiei]UPX16248.1 hypothetical protein EKO05_0006658 [Ascochyta rabiei]